NCDLLPDIPHELLERFERCRDLFAYSIFNCSFLAVVSEFAWLTVEMALRTRLHYAHHDKVQWLYEKATLGPLLKLAKDDGLLTERWNPAAIKGLRHHLAHVKETATLKPEQAVND